MDKLDLFMDLARLAAGNDLDEDDVRLYILLLANSRELGNGRIEYVTIKSAIGAEFSREKLRTACQRLAANRLVVVTSEFPDSKIEKNFVLSYMILPTRYS